MKSLHVPNERLGRTHCPLLLCVLFASLFVPIWGWGQTNVSGNVSGAWTLAGSPYVLSGSITIPAGNTLTIQPGVQVQFPTYDRYFTINGTLLANGTSTDSIRFTGIANPGYHPNSSHGGYIRFESNSVNSNLDYVIFDRLGDVSTGGEAVSVNSSSVTINHSTIKNSEQYGISVLTGKSPVIANCYFTANDWGIRLEPNAAATLDGCSFGVNNRDVNAAPSALTNIQGNNLNADIFIIGGTLSAHTNWPKPGINSRFKLDGQVSVSNGVTLTIQAGVAMDFQHYNASLDISGTLIANGTAGDSIYFTGSPNPTYHPQSSHGGYIRFAVSSTNSSLEYVVIDRIGDVNILGMAVECYTSSLTMDHCAVRNSEGTGVNIGTFSPSLSAAPVIRNCLFINNPKDIQVEPSGTTNLTQNTGADIYIASMSTKQSGQWRKQMANSLFHVIGNVTVEQGDSITVEPGVWVQADHYFAHLDVQGTFLAVGTPQDSIQFYGVSNPAYGPTSTHGGYLRFRNTSLHSKLDYVIIDRMGDTGTGGRALNVESSSLSIERSAVRNCEQSGIYIGLKSATQAATPVVKNCLFVNNLADMEAEPSGLSQVIQNIGADIYLVVTGTKQSGQWRKQTANSLFHLTGIVTVDVSDTIAVEPGVWVQSDNYSGHLDVQGTLLAVGTAQDSIRFYGVSNTAYTPASTHGGYIRFRNTSLYSNLDYVVIDRMGDLGTGGRALNVESSSLSIERSAVRNCEQSGIYIGLKSATQAATPVVKNCLFVNNLADMEAEPSGLSQVVQNTGADIYLVVTGTKQSGQWRKQTANSLFHLTGIVTVDVSDTIAVEPGVWVQSDNYSGHLDVQGTLLAVGTAQDSIRFYGVSNTAYTPASTHGGYIRFRNTSLYSKLDYVAIDRMGDLDTGGRALNVESSSLSIERSTIRNSERSGIYLGLFSGTLAADPLVKNCRFFNNPADMEAQPSGLSNVLQNVDADIFVIVGDTKQTGFWRKQTANSLFHLTGTTVINTGDSITVEPGVWVQSDNYSGHLDVQGTLLAVGTAQDSIRFYGVSNTAYTPASTHGGYIRFRNTSLYSKLDYVVIDRMGDLGTGGRALNVESSSLSIERSAVRNCEQSGIYIGQESGTLAAVPLVKNCLFSTNPADIEAFSSGLSNVSLNTDADIFVITGSTFQSGYWRKQNAGSLFHIGAGTVTVAQGDTISIEPGVRVRFDNYSGVLSVAGTLLAQGSAQDSITFFGIVNTTYNLNSTHGGSIRFTTTSQNSKLQYVVINRLGDASTGGVALNIQTSSLSITYSTIKSGEQTGISVTNAIPVIRYTNITGHQKGIRVTAGQFIIFNCNIYGNTQFGIENVATDTTDARNNWWGANSGPFHAVLNPGGQGNPVSNKVKFTPWLTGTAAIPINDVAVATVLAPVSNCGLGSQETVRIRIYNNGNIIQTGFNVGYTVNNNPPVVENVGALIVQPNGTADYTFTGKADMSATGNHAITAYTLLANDTLPSNDTLVAIMVNYANLAAPSNLLPANGVQVSSLSVPLSWSTVPLATLYDVFIWESSASPPANPTVSSLAQPAYLFVAPGNGYGKTYNWKVKAKNTICATESPVQSFMIANLPDLIVSSVQAPDTASTTASISVEWTTFNQGLGGTSSTAWYEYLYLAETPDLSGGNQYLLRVTPRLSALNSNQGYTQLDQMGTIPQNIVGPHYIVVQVTGGPLESNGNNNRLAVPIYIKLTPPADLQVDSVTVFPTNTFSGQNVTVAWKVTNHGNGNPDRTSWNDALYLSTNDSLQLNQATFLGSYQRAGGLATDSSYWRSASVNIPLSVFGTFFIHAVTDHTGRVFESLNENNNTRVSDSLNILLTPPVDLAVTAITHPAAVSNGQNVTLNWTVVNQGGSSTYNNWSDGLYIGPDSIFSHATLLLSVAQTQSLAPGQSRSYQASVTLPPGLLQGSFYFFVKTDVTNTLFEYIFEDNNTLRSPGTVLVENPDLVVAKVSVPANALSGQPLPVQWTVKNTGPGRAVNASRTDRIYLSATPVFQPNNATLLNAGIYVDQLLPGDSIVKQRTVSLPNGIQDAFYMHVVVDANNNITETDNNNNAGFAPLAVTLADWPDLQVSAVQVPDSADAGDKINIIYTVLNAGADTVANSNWTDRISLTNSPVPGNGSALFQSNVSVSLTLPPDSAYTRSVNMTLPVSLNSGPYFFQVNTDVDNRIYEHSDENNNRASSDTLAVTAYPPVDLKVTTASVADDSAQTGQSLLLHWTVQNASNLATVATPWEDAVYLSAGDAILDSADVLLGLFPRTGVLAAGASYSMARAVTMPESIAGDIFLLVLTDATAVHNDQNRSNNFRVVGLPSSDTLPVIITVDLTPPCDLQVTALNAPAGALAGQPVEAIFTIKNMAIGSTTAGLWQDRFYLSNDLVLDEADALIGVQEHPGNLGPNQSYTDTLMLNIPVTAAGNKLILVKTDYNDQQYEHLAEGNNQAAAPLLVIQPPPCDLIVDEVITPTMNMAGQEITIEWTLKNTGANPAVGNFKEGVFLSADTVYDANDVLFAMPAGYLAVPPGSTVSHSVTAPLTTVSASDYYILVRTDILNNIVELSDNNNAGRSATPLSVDIPVLPLGISTPDTMLNNRELYYRVIIPPVFDGEAMLVALTGDSLNMANNELYLRHGAVPTRANYDFAFTNAFAANQEVVVPVLEAGTYYLMAYGTAPDSHQPVHLLAKLLPFEIRSVDANQGGNTGAVTVRMLGGQFEENMTVFLESVSLGRIYAFDFIHMAPTEAFARFDLAAGPYIGNWARAGVPPGVYDVVAVKANGVESRLKNGFTVSEGNSPDLKVDLVYPPNTTVNRIVSMTLTFLNDGDTDIVMPKLAVLSLEGAPIALSGADLQFGFQDVEIRLVEPGGPPDVIRPGATGTVKIFAKSNRPLRFKLVELK